MNHQEQERISWGWDLVKANQWYYNNRKQK
jgi:hypothetical protein